MLFEKLKEVGRIILYTITFKLIFAILKLFFKAFFYLLKIGFSPILFYLCIGSLLYIFLDFKIKLFEKNTVLYFLGLFFWLVLSVFLFYKKILIKTDQKNRMKALSFYENEIIEKRKIAYLEDKAIRKNLKKIKKEEKRNRIKKKIDSYFFYT